MKVRIRENSWLAAVAAKKMRADKVAMVIGNTIHLHQTTRDEFLNDSSWVCHELKHVQQYKEKGIAGFLFQYLISTARNGYYNNRFETEARAAETDLSLLRKVEFT